MRKKFIFIVLVPLVVLGAVTYFYLDSWVESGLETAGESLVGAKVEIDDLRLGLFPLRVQFERLQVANPNDRWKNLFETGRVTFAVDANQLLRNKIIIDTVEVRNVILGTKRTTDGSLPQRPDQKDAPPSFAMQLAKQVESEVRSVPIFDLEKLRKDLNLDSLLRIQNLLTIQHLDSMKHQALALSGQWKSTLADYESTRQRVMNIESNLRTIHVNELKTLDAITAAVNNVNTSYNTLREINETLTTRKNAITNDITRLTGSIGHIDDVVRADIERVKSLARLPELRLGGVTDLLFAQQLYAEAQTYLGYVDLVKRTVRKYTPKPDFERPKRFEGQDIHFPVDRAYPRLWIKTAHLSGGTDAARDPNYISVSGDISDITNNQSLTGKPISALIRGTKGNRMRLEIGASLDRRGNHPLDQYRATISGIPMGEMKIGRASFLPSRITQSDLAINAAVTVPGRTFDAQTTVSFREVRLVFEQSPRNTVERLARDVLDRVRNFDTHLRAWNTEGRMKIHFSTDLDNELYEQTKRVLGEELNRIQNEIRSKVNQKIAEKRQEVERVFEEKKQEALARIREYENLLGERLALVETKKRELEKHIEEEKAKGIDAAKKKLEDAMKGLIRKQ
ncbi:MAG: TIGR03545 family protein [Ignavibacteria bacterium]|nr:TIGR03545 family protein [Ignavibacteria bacterium]